MEVSTGSSSVSTSFQQTHGSDSERPAKRQNTRQLARAPALFVWGKIYHNNNDDDDETTSRNEPLYLEHLHENLIKKLVISKRHHMLPWSGKQSFVVTLDGKVQQQQRFDHHHHPRRRQQQDVTQQGSFVPNNHSIVDMTCGFDHFAAIDSQGQLYVWGKNKAGKLGHAPLVARNDGRNDALPPNGAVTVPKLVNELIGIRIQQVGCGIMFTVALAEDGTVYSWGSHQCGYTGHGLVTGNSCTPRPIKGPLTNERITQIAVGSNHTAALTHHGKLYTWGEGRYGKLGHGNQNNHAQPQYIHHDALDGKVVIHVACYDHTLAVTQGGQLFSWGRNEFGACGTGGRDELLVPTLVTGLNNVTKAACGKHHSAAITQQGTLYCWGSNVFGQVGIGATNETYVLYPQRVKQLNAYTVVDVDCGTFETIGFVDPLSMPASDAKPAAVVTHLMYDNPDSFPDFTFFVQGQRIPAHRCILASKSPYFANLFRSSMQEANAGTAVISEISKHHFCAVLNYLYSGSLMMDLVTAVELFGVADFLCLDALKRLCIQTVHEALTVATAADTLQRTAAQCHDELKTICLSFIKENFKEVVSSTGFENLPRELMIELCRASTT